MRWVFTLLFVGVLLSPLPAQEHGPVADDTSGLEAGYGFDPVLSDYEGPVVVVRRSSDDAEESFGINDAQFDEQAFQAFVGSDTAYVARLFDQTDSDFHARQDDPTHQPWLVNGPKNSKLLSVQGEQGMALPGVYSSISGGDEFTIFVPVRWDGSNSDEDTYLFNATRYGTGSRPLGITLEGASDRHFGRPKAALRLEDETLVELAAEGTFGRADAMEIHELVFEHDNMVALYNSGRLVDVDTLEGASVEESEPFEEGVFLANNGDNSAGLSGEIVPPLIFDRALSSRERAEVRQELARRHGFEIPSNRPPSGDEFTFVYIPDTQKHAANIDGASSERIQQVMEWIDENESAWNIEMVFHAGDVVDAGFNTPMWERADEWFQRLDQTGIPYAVVPGNHDYQGDLNDRNSENYNEYFPTSRYTDTNWWNGNFYEEGKTDNFYFTRTIRGEEYLILGLEFQPRSGVVEWADEVLREHPDKKAVILTHDLMEEAGRFTTRLLIDSDATSGREMYQEVFSQHDNVFLVMNGHHGVGSARRYDPSTEAHYMYFDPASIEVGKKGSVRLLVVSPSRGTIRGLTYSPAFDEFYDDYENLFTFDINARTESGREENDRSEQPSKYRLEANYPNPFNASTVINYAIPEATHVEITVYDLWGREVGRLVEGHHSAGEHSLRFDAGDLSSGMYIYRMDAGDFTRIRRMMVVK